MKTKKISLKLGSYAKLAAKYCGQLEILERIGPVTYRITLSTSMHIRNVFHISLRKKQFMYANHLIDWNMVQMEPKGDFQIQLV